MKEQGIFFTDEQKKLLQEIDKLEKSKQENEDERKTLNTTQRMVIASSISDKYSMLSNCNGIFSSQLFSAMEDYLKECTKKDYNLTGL